MAEREQLRDYVRERLQRHEQRLEAHQKRLQGVLTPKPLQEVLRAVEHSRRKP
jgi:hypothetical protein